MTAPVLVGTAVGFDSTPTTPTVAKSVTAGNLVAIWFATNNGQAYSLSLSDSMGGVDTDWSGGGWVTTDPCQGGWRWRVAPSTGTITVTMDKPGGIIYSGLCVEINNFDAAIFDGASVGAYTTASPASATPTTTTYATDLLLAGLTCNNSANTAVSAYSDTHVATQDTAGGRQAQIQSRTTTSAGAQAAMTFTHSGVDARASVSVLNIMGKTPPTPAVLSSPGVDQIADVSARIYATSDIGGGTYHAVVSTSATAPTEAQIKAGSGGGIVAHNSGTLVAGVNALTVSGLNASTTYYGYALAYNGSDSNIVSTGSFSTTATAPVITGVSSATPADGASLTITSAGGATGFGATQSGGSVTLGGTTLTVTSWSDTSVTATVSLGTNLFGTALGTVVTNGLTGLSSASFAGVTGIVPPTGYDVVILAALNSESDAVLLEALPALATSNQIEWETVGGLVTVNNDATVTWDPSVTEFDVRAGVSTDGWGDWKTVQLSSGGANTLTSSLSAAIQAAISATASASAAVQTGRTATVGADTYVGVAATPEISASVSAAVQSSPVATTSLAAAVQATIAATAGIDTVVQAGRASTVSISACVVTSVPEGVSCVRMTASMTRPVRLTTEITQCRLG